MKRILICSPFYVPHLGGLETYVKELTEALVKKDFEVTILTSNIATASISDHQGYRVIYFPAFELLTNYPVPQFWKPGFWHAIKESIALQPDVVMSHTRFFLTSLLAGAIARYIRKPWVHVEHGSWFVNVSSPLTNFLSYCYDMVLGRLVLRFSTHTIAISKAVQTFIQRFDARSSLLLYRGLDTTLLDSISPQRPAIAQSKFLIVCVGRLFKWKGFQYVIEAVKDLPVTLVIAGDGEDRDRLERKASSNVIFLGQVSYRDTIALIKSADLYIHSSLQGGGLSTALLEALYCGAPVIATPNEGADEVVIHNETGVVIPAADSNVLAETIKTLMHDQLLRKKLGQQAHKKIKPIISWDHTVEELTDLFNNLAKDAPRTI